MINVDDYMKESKTKHNQKWPYILDHWHRILRILIIGGSRSGKNNVFLN